jgi:two-component system phosphate regulon response regulator PhoB
MPQTNPSVLIVEDEPAQREVLAYNFEAQGFRVSQSDNGEEALLLVAEETPDLIVLDWMLPMFRALKSAGV